MLNLVTVQTISGLELVKDQIACADIVAFDSETTGVDNSANIIGFSLSFDTETGYYIPLMRWNKDTQALERCPLNGQERHIFEALRGKSLVMHNAIFDCALTNRLYSIDLMPSVHTDTMLLAHLLDENRANGLKELSISIFGEDAAAEQRELEASIVANGGSISDDKYELYKADMEVIAKYGAKDTVLTMMLFYELVPQLYEQKLDKFFYEDETMPLLRGPSYELNTVGLKVDQAQMEKLKSELEAECLIQKATVLREIAPHISEKYPATSKAKTFNIGAPQQLAWLLFEKLSNEFLTLTDSGRDLCHILGIKIPYAPGAKRAFIAECRNRRGEVYAPEGISVKTGKKTKAKKVKDFWQYLKCNKEVIAKYAEKYKWCAVLAAYNKNLKLINTYICGILSRIQYGIIHPSFLSHVTPTGRYASREPNFQNLPRDDKRIKACIIARAGKKLVGADFEQIEPRTFASLSGDERLIACFANGDDFYSVIGVEVFGKYECTLKKDENEPNYFGNKYPKLRNLVKTFALSAAYGTTAFQLAPKMGISADEAQELINDYFEKFPKVKQLQLDTHKKVKETGVVYNLFGRPRRLPEATTIQRIYGNSQHSDLPYAARNILNQAMNFPCQSTAASIINRASIAIHKRKASIPSCKLVLQCHDELNYECDEKDVEVVSAIIQDCMENTVKLPGVMLHAVPKAGNNLSELK